MIEVIIIGILLCVSVILTAFKGRNSSCDFYAGIFIGAVITILMVLEICLVGIIK